MSVVDKLKFGKVLGGSQRNFSTIEAMIKTGNTVSKSDRTWYNNMLKEKKKKKK